MQVDAMDSDGLLKELANMNNVAPFARDASVDIPLALQSNRPHTLSLQAKQSFQEGIVCLQSGDAATAVAALSRCIEYAPDFTDARVFLGVAHSLTSNIYPAIDELETAAKLDNDSFAAHFTLAKLCFKLRIPQKGHESATQALRCVQTMEQRKMLTRLLMEERARMRNGISRPWFNKPFGIPAL
ncbi:MAG TPA: tetratricopeptide repeat protein, partial [Terriglobia bacterium]|nr:tetratricopeptide repeat protein [Terriglobia bacterium]